MAVNTPLDVALPSSAPLPVPFSQLLWARDIANAGNLANVSVPGSTTLWFYVRTSAPIIAAIFFSAGSSPLVHVLQRSRAPHVFRFAHAVDHVILSLASLPGNLGQAGTLGLPLEGSSLSYPQSAAAPRGDGYVLLSGIDQPAEYQAPALDTAPRFAVAYNAILGSLSTIALGPIIPVRSVTRVDLMNAGTPGTSAVLNFQLTGIDLGPSGFANDQIAGTLPGAGSGLWNLSPGQAESVDLDLPPGAQLLVTVDNEDVAKSSAYTVVLWGY